jgi:hypothetical protein
MINGQHNLGFLLTAAQAAVVIACLQFLPLGSRVVAAVTGLTCLTAVLYGAISVRIRLPPALRRRAILIAVLGAPCSRSFADFWQKAITIASLVCCLCFLRHFGVLLLVARRASDYMVTMFGIVATAIFSHLVNLFEVCRAPTLACPLWICASQSLRVCRLTYLTARVMAVTMNLGKREISEGFWLPALRAGLQGYNGHVSLHNRLTATPACLQHARGICVPPLYHTINVLTHQEAQIG